MSLFLRGAAASDIGLVRTNNEDTAHVSRQLLAVADGIGGQPAGELASEFVIRALAELDAEAVQGDPLPALRAAVETASEQIRDAAASDQAHRGMGTTVTALLLSGDQLGLLHVGDSRCYRLRDGKFSQLTKDDTFVQSLVDQGVLTADEARRHPRRSIVTNAVQGEPLAPTCTLLVPHADDRYLLCSDGLSDYVTDDAIAQALLSYAEPQACVERLVKLALQVGAPDNVTVVVADVAAGEADEAPA
jgi:PPM family protein phosphatase